MPNKSAPPPALKTFLPLLGEWLGVSAAQIYERQRLLVDAGILKQINGRGPGSGVPATPQNISKVLVALLVGELRQDFERAVKAVCAAKSDVDYSESLKTRTFAETISFIIADGFPDAREWPNRILLHRDTLEAQIVWPLDLDGNATFTTRYLTDSRKPLRGLRVVAELSVGVLRKSRRQLVHWQTGRPLR